MKINAIRPNSANPRKIKDPVFKKLCKSVKEFPKMLALRPIVVEQSKYQNHKEEYETSKRHITKATDGSAKAAQ